MLGLTSSEIFVSFFKTTKKEHFSLYFNVDMKENTEWIDTILFENLTDENADYVWEEGFTDERLNVAVVIKLKEI